jgi:hypothetical protein
VPPVEKWQIGRLPDHFRDELIEPRLSKRDQDAPDLDPLIDLLDDIHDSTLPLVFGNGPGVQGSM